MKEDAARFIAAVHAAQVEIINANESLEKRKAGAMHALEPARRRMKVEPILPMIIRLRHAARDLVAAVGGQEVRLPVEQEKAVIPAKQKIHETGDESLLGPPIGCTRR